MGRVETFNKTEFKRNPRTGKMEKNNKYYVMIEDSDGQTFHTEWGAVGCKNPQRQKNLPISKWDSKIKDRIKHGYMRTTDLQADLYVDVPTDEVENPSDNAYAPIPDNDVATIVEYLSGLSTANVRQNYKTTVIGSVTQAMVDKAQEAIDSLAEISCNKSLREDEAVELFNDQLKKLFMILPRKMDISQNLCSCSNEFSKIIDREQVLLNNMRYHVVEKNSSRSGKKEAKTTKSKRKTILEENGIKMRSATLAEEKQIKQILGLNASLYANAWRVENEKTESRFNEFVKSSRITDIKHLIHGTSDKNVWPISVFGLTIRPANQATNGSNLGRGNYFANDSRKSLQYAYGGRTFLLIMKVAYGKPHNEYSWNYGLMNLDHDSFRRRYPDCDVMHAHASIDYRYDEIVTYEDARSTIEYIVEIKRRR